MTWSGESWGFTVGDNLAIHAGDLLWFGPLKSIQKLFFHTPLVNVFVFGSETYHDYYRWPLRHRRTFEAWKRDTSWGCLFDAHARGERARIAGARGRGRDVARIDSPLRGASRGG